MVAWVEFWDSSWHLQAWNRGHDVGIRQAWAGDLSPMVVHCTIPASHLCLLVCGVGMVIVPREAPALYGRHCVNAGFPFSFMPVEVGRAP